MLDWIVNFIAQASIARALAFGLVSGIMLTQWVKFQLPDWLSNRAHANGVRVISSLLTTATVRVLWPDAQHAVAWAMAIGAGLTTPFAYWLGVKLLYRYLPQAEDVLSARPEPKEPPT